jgi:ethanolamine permease
VADFDIASKKIDGIGPHGTRVGLLRVLGPAHVWALGIGIVLVGEYMGWNFAVGKGGAYSRADRLLVRGHPLFLHRHDRLGGHLHRRLRRRAVYPGQAHHRPPDGLQLGLYLVFAYTMLEAANAITAGYLFSVVASMTGHAAELDQRPFIILVIMFLAWLNYRGVLATLTFNLVITAIAFGAIILLFLSTSGILGGGIMDHAALFEGHELPYGWIGVLAAMHSACGTTWGSRARPRRPRKCARPPGRCPSARWPGS